MCVLLIRTTVCETTMLEHNSHASCVVVCIRNCERVGCEFIPTGRRRIAAFLPLHRNGFNGFGAPVAGELDVTGICVIIILLRGPFPSPSTPAPEYEEENNKPTAAESDAEPECYRGVVAVPQSRIRNNNSRDRCEILNVQGVPKVDVNGVILTTHRLQNLSIHRIDLDGECCSIRGENIIEACDDEMHLCVDAKTEGS